MGINTVKGECSWEVATSALLKWNGFFPKLWSQSNSPLYLAFFQRGFKGIPSRGNIMFKGMEKWRCLEVGKDMACPGNTGLSLVSSILEWPVISSHVDKGEIMKVLCVMLMNLGFILYRIENIYLENFSVRFMFQEDHFEKV
jgi:hypothetical protein